MWQGPDRRGIAICVACGVLLMPLSFTSLFALGRGDPVVDGGRDPHFGLRLLIFGVFLAGLLAAATVFGMLGFPLLLGKTVSRQKTVGLLAVLAIGYGLGVAATVLTLRTDL